MIARCFATLAFLAFSFTAASAQASSQSAVDMHQLLSQLPSELGESEDSRTRMVRFSMSGREYKFQYIKARGKLQSCELLIERDNTREEGYMDQFCNGTMKDRDGDPSGTDQAKYLTHLRDILRKSLYK
jgi:hypothetical protein